MTERKRAYVTKYALTQGILDFPYEPCCEDNGEVRMVKIGPLWYAHKPYWYLDRDEAVAHAKKLRDAKVKNLKKQIAKLEAATFEPKS